MNTTCKILLLCLLCILIYPCITEGYINKPLKDEPDDLQFYACHGKDKIKYKGKDYDSLGYNNYKLKKHGIGVPLQGVYSHFLDTYELRKYDELFHAPICESGSSDSYESKYSFNGISNLEPPEILKQLNDEIILNAEEEYETNSIKDPYYTYVNPEYISNKLTYSDELNELFLKTHGSQSDQNLLHRLDSRIDIS